MLWEPEEGCVSPGLARALRARTRSLHRRAERSGFVADLIRGRASRRGYLLFLRNLQPTYAALERGLSAADLDPRLHWRGWRALARRSALEADLASLAGPRWPVTLPLLPAGLHYGQCIEAAAREDGVRLLAHAYVRYFGDLSGGQILQVVLARSLALPAGALTLYDFPAIPDIERFKSEFRARLDRADAAICDLEPVLAEAEAAFRFNIELSEAVRAAAMPSREVPPAA